MSKFLTYEERLMIAQGLKEHKSFGAIGSLIGKDRTTVAKEIKRHSFEKSLLVPAIHLMPASDNL